MSALCISRSSSPESSVPSSSGMLFFGVREDVSRVVDSAFRFLFPVT